MTDSVCPCWRHMPLSEGDPLAARPSGDVDVTTSPLIWNDGYEAAIRDMENEGVVTWGDDRHRARFLALDGRREEG